MIEKRQVSAASRKIVELVRAHPQGIERAALPVEVKAWFPSFPLARLDVLVAEAAAAGLLEASGTRVSTPASEEGAAGVVSSSPLRSSSRNALRAVALDIESVVRTIPSAPYLERHVYEVAARRFGADDDWVTDQPLWQRFLRFPGYGEALRDERVRIAVRDRGVEAEDAWVSLRAYLSDADIVVAYNGSALDFPVVREAADRCGIRDPFGACRPVDALYLAHTVWPTASSHRLEKLAEAVGATVSGARAHTAGGDVEVLVELLRSAAAELDSLGEDLAGLIADVCWDSDGWRLLRELCHGPSGGVREPPQWEQAHVARLLGAQLAHHVPRRGSGETATGRASVLAPDALRGTDGRVDPTALARVVREGDVEPRPAQQQMTETLHYWTDQGVSGLIEAPTGTGKSYAILAAAVDWLAGGSDRTAVIATYTKQLQGQMAKDLENLQRALPGILSIADLVKGQSSRLSLAALTQALTDSARRREGRIGGREHGRLLRHPRFRELIVYLTLRLRASCEAPASWTARSVDPVDVPAFFADYAGHALPQWLEALSQRDGDFTTGADNPLAPHTDTVREAVAGHRLVLANHALALSHLDDLRALGPETLLILDEAHELENAATSALTVAVDYQDIEVLLSEYAAVTAVARPGEARERVVLAVDEFERLLDDERLPRMAARAFDGPAKGIGVRVGSRATALASPYTGTAGSRDTRAISRALTGIARAATTCRIALERYAAAHTAELDPLVRERLTSLALRTDTITSALGRIAEDIEVFLDQAVTLTAELPSRVVHMEELAEPAPELRAYRFRMSSSPVELPADPEWRRFLTSFQRVHYVSATLRVSGAWDFIRARLGLPADLPTLALSSPFDLERQAEVVCLSDFPSWAEQEEGALLTVAHQLAGFAREMVHESAEGGYVGGGMVLTTARSTAAGIGAHLVRELHARNLQAPVVEALALGNGRAYREFTDPEHGGGFLVGTKGLWQGVDVADDERLRLVWINKLPFAPFAAPIVEARRAAVCARAEASGHPDPEGVATEHYYLPLAALQLRQAVGRLVRSRRHRGVVVISDRKLAGSNALRRSYRRAFLGSLDQGLERPDPHTGEAGGGNVTTMVEGWRRIWEFMVREELLAPERAAELCTDVALDEHTLLPFTRRIRDLALTTDEVDRLRAEGGLASELLDRCSQVAGLLRLTDDPVALKPAQREVITAVAEDRNVLGLLPTGFGKSFTFQLPALVMPGVTLVVSPLVALMQDQALDLNRSIGGAVRALISPLRESSSRAGKTEVADQLKGRQEHGIRLVYVSPERLCQRRFRELVREAVEAGRVRRIAVDEAHTMAQWEDFRPSMRRVSRFLGELRRDFGLPVTAVTATANRTVHESLRKGLFGLPETVPAPGSAAERDEPTCPSATGGLVTVRENPIRPELAVYRRAKDRWGQGGVAGIVERVVDALHGHAILYCLTVKEVNTLYTHLREYIGDSGVRVLRFHSRLTGAEKSATMNEFREAPHEGEDGFRPVVVVATSAFGLGINRPDIRTVFCVSPPTDLAALYQQLGRAGRDSVGTGTDGAGPVNAGMALATNRGMRLVRFMTGQDLAVPLLRRMGDRLLAGQDGSFDPARLADDLMNEDAERGDLTEAELDDRHTHDLYQAGVMRAFSALADLGAVTDLGDHPPLCAVKSGDLGLESAPAVPHGQAMAEGSDAVERLIIQAALAHDTPARVDVRALDRRLADMWPAYREFAEGPAATWEILADLHDRGLLDVSAAPSRRMVTGIVVHTRRLPDGFLALLGRRRARADEEFAQLRRFFASPGVCAQRLFADYFGVAVLPEGCCTTERCRCSACWDGGQWPVGERRPEIASAFTTSRPREADGTDSVLRRQRVDQQARRLLQLQPQGMHPRTLWHALRGDESSFNPLSRKAVTLPAALRESRHFGGRADLPFAEVTQTLQRFQEAGMAEETATGLWRMVRRPPRPLKPQTPAMAASHPGTERSTSARRRHV